MAGSSHLNSEQIAARDTRTGRFGVTPPKRVSESSVNDAFRVDVPEVSARAHVGRPVNGITVDLNITWQDDDYIRRVAAIETTIETISRPDYRHVKGYAVSVWHNKEHYFSTLETTSQAGLEKAIFRDLRSSRRRFDPRGSSEEAAMKVAKRQWFDDRFISVDGVIWQKTNRF